MNQPRPRIQNRIHKAEPWRPADYDVSDHLAVQALAKGRADAAQQERAWAWILFAAGYGDKSFRAGGLAGQRDTDFAEGKKWVAEQMIKLAETNIAIHERKS